MYENSSNTMRLVIASLLLCHVLGEPIIGGHICDIMVHPWLASIQKNGRHECGGSIISENVVLTAAHCIVQVSMDSLAVRVGSSRSNSGGSVHRVITIQLHESFQGTGGAIDLNVNDLALIKVTPAFKFDRSVAVIKLAEKGHVVRPGTVVGVAGWGSVVSDGSSIRDLKSTVLTVVDSAECSRAYEDLTSTKISSNKLMCASDNGNDSCKGDSGSPLVEVGVQVGVVSTGVGCADPKYPGVYTEISRYRDWIDKYTQLLR